MTDNCIRSYLQEVEDKLVCSAKSKKLFIKELSADVEEFADNIDELSTDSLYRRFGTPTEVADAFVSQMRSSDIEEKVAHKRMIALALVSGLVVLIAAVAIGIGCFKRWEFFSHPDGYIMETPVYIVDEEQVDEYFESLRRDGARIY